MVLADYGTLSTQTIPTDPTPPHPWVVEAALAARARNGDRDAFAALYDSYSGPIFNLCFRMMAGRSDLAEELTQDIFLKAWLKLPRAKEETKFGPWLYRVGQRVCLDEIRHRRLLAFKPWDAFVATFHPSQVSPEPTPLDTVIESQVGDEVQIVLNALKPQHRMVLLLREYHELSYDDIAEVFVTTRAAVKSLLYRARCEFATKVVRLERAGKINLTDGRIPVERHCR